MSLPYGNLNNGNHPMNPLAGGFLNSISGDIVSERTRILNQNLLTNTLQSQIASQSLQYIGQPYINPLIPLQPAVDINSLPNQPNVLGKMQNLYTSQQVGHASDNQLPSSTYNQTAPAIQALEARDEGLKQVPAEQPGVNSWSIQNMSQPVILSKPIPPPKSSKTSSSAGDGILGDPPGAGTPPQAPNGSVVIILRPSNARQFSQYRIRSSIHTREIWHKFIIVNGAKLDKEKVLKRILDFVLPTLLIPSLYQQECKDTFFLSRNCGNSIDRLCQRNLVIPPDSNFDQPIQLNIHLEYATSNEIRVKTSEILTSTLKKRLNDMCLDLSDFHHDPDLERLMFFPLSQPIILHYVLSAAASRLSLITSLILSNNGLRTLKTLDVLLKLSTLRSLDLRNNELLYQNDIQDLSCLHELTHLYLDGNPVCAEFKTPREYIRFVKSILPNVESVDGVSLCLGSVTQQNYLPNDKSARLIDQFLRHYFNRYDWESRNVLDGLYHPDVLLSMTCAVLPGQNTSHSCSLPAYTPHNRNILSLSDFSLTQKRLYKGSAEVLELLCSLPPSSHDQYSFRVDVLQYSDVQVTFAVQGTFWEKLSEERKDAHIRSFNRVFVIICTGRNEWQIVNEMLHVSNATDKQVANAFKYAIPPLEQPTETSLWQDAELLKDTDKSGLVATLVQLSTLNISWAIRYLKEAKWNLREALINFVEQYEGEKIPPQAFKDSVV